MEQPNLRGLTRAIALCFLGISKSWAIADIQIDPPPFPFEIAALEADARRGDVSAQRQLGAWYEEGWGVKADARQAAKWYLEAAKQGDTLARYKVAWLYELGRGVIRSHSKAVKWYRKAKSGIDMAAGHTADTGRGLVSGQFLIAIDEFVAHPPPPQITITPLTGLPPDCGTPLAPQWSPDYPASGRHPIRKIVRPPPA